MKVWRQGLILEKKTAACGYLKNKPGVDNRVTLILANFLDQ